MPPRSTPHLHNESPNCSPLERDNPSDEIASNWSSITQPRPFATSTPRTFPKFSKLPTELRLQIWEFSLLLLTPKTITTYNRPHLDDSQCPETCPHADIATCCWNRSLPSTFYTTKESRAAALATFRHGSIADYSLNFNSESSGLALYGRQFLSFNCDRDTVLFENYISWSVDKEAVNHAKHIATRLPPLFAYEHLDTYDKWTPWQRSNSESIISYIEIAYGILTRIMRFHSLTPETVDSITLILPHASRYHDNPGNGPFRFDPLDFCDDGDFVGISAEEFSEADAQMGDDVTAVLGGPAQAITYEQMRNLYITYQYAEPVQVDLEEVQDEENSFGANSEGAGDGDEDDNEERSQSEEADSEQDTDAEEEG